MLHTVLIVEQCEHTVVCLGKGSNINIFRILQKDFSLKQTFLKFSGLKKAMPANGINIEGE